MSEKDKTNRPTIPDVTRRTLLRSAAVGTVAGIGATAAIAQDDEALEGEIELGGQRGGWQGIAPDEIADEENPTLTLTEGEDYTVTWENEDGEPHNFSIETGDGEDLVSSEIMDESGETQTVEFTAESEMAEYYCAPHPQQMRGEVEIVGGDGGGGNETTDEGDGFFDEGPTVGLETVAEELTAPVDFQVADEEQDRRFVVDQTGQIYVHGEDGLEDEPFLDVSDQMVELMEDFDERGLLGLAFHPDFEENGRFFVRYSAPPREETPEDYDHTFVLSEFGTEGDDNESADPDSEQVLLEIDEPQFNHNSGMVAFGPDDYLYVTTGDGGGGNDNDEGHVEDWYDENEGGNGQNTTENLLGGVLRIDVDAGTDDAADDGAETDDTAGNETEGDDAGDGGAGDGADDRAYGIPEDNPFAEGGEFESDQGLEEYYAWGLRNPWGSMEFHNEQLLIADVGQELYEEANVIEKGGNYGWNVKEGTHCFSTETPEEPPEDCPDETPDDVRGGEELIDPVVEYPQEHEGEPVGASIIGGHVYDGDTVSSLEDTYVFADWTGPLFIARPPEGWTEDEGMDDGGDVGDGDGVGDGNETDDTAGNETDVGTDDDDVGGNETADDGVGNETTDDGVGNETTDDGVGNETADDGVGAGNETDDAAGNETDAGDGDMNAGDAEDDLWPMERLVVEDEELAADGALDRNILGFGQDSDGEVYVLTTDNTGPTGDTGQVHRIVQPEGDGGAGDGDDAGAGNETEEEEEEREETVEEEEGDDATGNETDDGVGDGNETDDTAGNETDDGDDAFL